MCVCVCEGGGDIKVLKASAEGDESASGGRLLHLPVVQGKDSFLYCRQVGATSSHARSLAELIRDPACSSVLNYLQPVTFFVHVRIPHRGGVP